MEINDVEDIVSIHHSIVSTDYAPRSDTGKAENVTACNLPNSDVLAIDADGAEIPILSGMKPEADKLIIEHHKVLTQDRVAVNYEPATIRSLIRGLGYEIVEEHSDPKRAYGKFEERVFVAKKQF